jgi:hypothetical protein
LEQRHRHLRLVPHRLLQEVQVSHSLGWFLEERVLLHQLYPLTVVDLAAILPCRLVASNSLVLVGLEDHQRLSSSNSSGSSSRKDSEGR